MPRFEILIPVELTKGRPFTIALESASAQWEAVRPEFRSGHTITIPPNQFHFSRAVQDELRFVWRDGQLFPPGGQRRILPGAVVIILESPHQHEYTPFYMPIAPLQKPASKTRLRNQLPRLLTEASIAMGDVVLANPIQFQTSLHRLLLPAYQSGVQSQRLEGALPGGAGRGAGGRGGVPGADPPVPALPDHQRLHGRGAGAGGRLPCPPALPGGGGESPPVVLVPDHAVGVDPFSFYT